MCKSASGLCRQAPIEEELPLRHLYFHGRGFCLAAVDSRLLAPVEE